MAIDIRSAGPEDLRDLVLVLEEVDRFYGTTQFAPLEERERRTRELLFRADPVGYALLARDDGAVVGLAAYSFHWPATGLTHSIFLKDLFVSATHRGQGVGRLLMDRLQSLGRERGCTRVEWTAERQSKEAQAFYRRLGFEPLPSKLFYRGLIR